MRVSFIYKKGHIYKRGIFGIYWKISDYRVDLEEGLKRVQRLVKSHEGR